MFTDPYLSFVGAAALAFMGPSVSSKPGTMHSGRELGYPWQTVSLTAALQCLQTMNTLFGISVMVDIFCLYHRVI